MVKNFQFVEKELDNLERYFLELKTFRSDFVKDYKLIDYLLLLEKIIKFNIIHNEAIAELIKAVSAPVLEPENFKHNLKKSLLKEKAAARLIDKYKICVEGNFYLNVSSDKSYFSWSGVNIWENPWNIELENIFYDEIFFFKKEKEVNEAANEISLTKKMKLVDTYCSSCFASIFKFLPDNSCILPKMLETGAVNGSVNWRIISKLDVLRSKNEASTSLSISKDLFEVKEGFIKNTKEVEEVIDLLDAKITDALSIPSVQELKEHYNTLKNICDGHIKT